MIIMNADKDGVLVTGALGQIGSELTPYLKEIHGKEKVLATDIKSPEPDYDDAYEAVNILDKERMEKIVSEYGIGTVYHLAAILSANGEKNPDLAWKVNVDGLHILLDIAKKTELKIFVPSSIAAFGPETPRQMTPQDTVMKPTTMYGITKVVGELLGSYYHEKFGVDVRGVRFPGIISNVALPGGGTTDYAVEIFFGAIKYKRYSCYLRADTSLDMMYMPDAIHSMIELMEADPSRLVHRNAYNITAMSFTPEILAEEIRRHIPEFEIDYEVDPARQKIADAWPDSMDDSAAREEWGWDPRYDLETMVADMIEKVGDKISRLAEKKY